MRKFLTYGSFVIASLLVIILFVTATTYLQLALAVVLYPVLAYFAVKIFSRRQTESLPVPKPVKVQTGETPTTPSIEPAPVQTEQEIFDNDKRTFLKLVGATGIFFFVSSLLGKRMDSLLLSGNGILNLNKVNNSLTSTAPSVDAAPSGSLSSSGYNISEIDDGAVTYYGFTSKTGAWLIMREDTENSSFRYAKGSSDFPSNWSNRTGLKYDYYYNLF